MRTLKISIRLLWPYILILVLLAAGFFVSLISFTNMRKQAETLYHGPYVLENAASTVRESLEATQKSLFRALLNNSQDITDEAISDATNSAVIIQEQAALLKQNTFGDVDSFLKFENNLSEFMQVQEHVLTLVAQNKSTEAAAYMENSVTPIIKETRNELEYFTLLAEKRAQELMTSFRQLQKKAILLLISLGAAGIVFSICGCIFIWSYQKKEKHSMMNKVQVT